MKFLILFYDKVMKDMISNLRKKDIIIRMRKEGKNFIVIEMIMCYYYDCYDCYCYDYYGYYG